LLVAGVLLPRDRMADFAMREAIIVVEALGLVVGPFARRVAFRALEPLVQVQHLTGQLVRDAARVRLVHRRGQDGSTEITAVLLEVQGCHGTAHRVRQHDEMPMPGWLDHSVDKGFEVGDIIGKVAHVTLLGLIW